MYNLSGLSRLAYFSISKQMHFMVSLMPQLVCYRVSIVLLGHVRVTPCRQLEFTAQEDYGGSACMWWIYFPRKLLYLCNYSQAQGWRPRARTGCSLLVPVEEFLGHEPVPVTLSAVLRRKVLGSWQAAMGSLDHVLNTPPPGLALPQKGLVIIFYLLPPGLHDWKNSMRHHTCLLQHGSVLVSQHIT